MVPGRAMLLPALPVVAEAWRARDIPRIRSIYQRSTRIMFLLGVFVWLCLVANLDGLFGFLKAEYAVGKPVLVILGITNLVALSSGISGGIISTSRNYAMDALSGGLFFVVNLVLDFLLILWLGAIGSAWSSLGATLALVIWRVLFLGVRHDLWPFAKGDWWRIAFPAMISAMAWMLPTIGPPMVDIVVRCGVLALLFWPVAILTGAAPEVRQAIGRFAGRFDGHQR